MKRIIGGGEKRVNKSRVGIEKEGEGFNKDEKSFKMRECLRRRIERS